MSPGNEVRKSEIVCFVGMSRYGKSLLMRQFCLNSYFANPHQRFLVWDSGVIANQWSKWTENDDGSISHSKYIPGPEIAVHLRDLQDANEVDIHSEELQKPFVIVTGDSDLEAYFDLVKRMAPCIMVADETDFIAGQNNYHPFVRRVINAGAHILGEEQFFVDGTEVIGVHAVLAFRRTTAIHKDICNKCEFWVCVRMKKMDRKHIENYITEDSERINRILALDRPIVKKYKNGNPILDQVTVFYECFDNEEPVELVKVFY